MSDADDQPPPPLLAYRSPRDDRPLRRLYLHASLTAPVVALTAFAATAACYLSERGRIGARDGGVWPAHASLAAALLLIGLLNWGAFRLLKSARWAGVALGVCLGTGFATILLGICLAAAAGG